MNKYINDLKKKYSEDLCMSSLEFLENGIDIFFKYLNSECSSMHIALSSLSTGLELALKAFISEKNLGVIFKDIPPDMRVLLTCPDKIPHFYEWRKFHPDIRSDKYETLNLSECVVSFYIFFPHMKQLLLPHVDLLIERGERSHHNILPPFELFDFQRSCYAALQMLSYLGEDKSSRLVYYTLTDRDKKFINTFERVRIERVKMAIEQANSNAYSMAAEHADAIVAHSWESYVTRCPVCGYNGYLTGYSEMAVGKDEEGPKPSLDFFATTFSCDVCGLKLNDIEELKLANMSILYDRSEDIDQWFHDRKESFDWFNE